MLNEASRGLILVVDDEDYVTRVVSRWLSAQGYECERVSNGQQALEALRRRKFALLITDITMPGMSGMELLERAQDEFPRTAVIMLTAVDDRDTATKALELGAYGYIIKPFEQNEVVINVANALRRRGLENMRDDFEGQLRKEVRRSQSEIVMRLMAASEYRDDETGAHIRRIGLFAAVLAERTGCQRPLAQDMQLAGAMHDVGKVGVPDGVLLKPGKLSAEEFETIKQHTTIGAQIVGETGIPLLDLAGEIALSHHEKWDGSGYPRGLAGEAIPQSGRIVALCDVYDALVSDRVYRPALPENEALAIMAEGRGKHFDPELHDCFLNALPELREIRAVTDHTFSGLTRAQHA